MSTYVPPSHRSDEYAAAVHAEAAADAHQARNPHDTSACGQPHSLTPVADALQVVDAAQDQPMPRFGSTRPGELDALRDLAGAVRSHGIGAELGQLRATARLAQWLAEAERAVTAAGEGQDVAGLLELLEALTAAVSDAQGPQRPRYEHAHCTGCGAWYLAGHGPGCGVGAAEADEAAMAAEAEQEARTMSPPVYGVTEHDGQVVIAVLPGVRDLAWYVVTEVRGGGGPYAVWFAAVDDAAGHLGFEPAGGPHASKRAALAALAELVGIAHVAPF